MDFKFNQGMELVITKNDMGIIVYDNSQQNRLDIFPDNDEGITKLLDFLKTTLEKSDEQ